MNSNAVSLCAGKQATLIASGAASYVWTPYNSSQMTFSLGPQTTVAPPSNTSYTVIGSVGNCTSSSVVNVSVNPNPTVLASTTKTSVCKNDIITLNASGADTYAWSSGETSASPTIAVTTVTNYIVTGTSLAGCTATASIKLKISSCVSLSENSINNYLTVYPNPSSGKINVRVNDAGGEARITIHNMLGQLMYDSPVNGSNILSVAGLAAGMYMVRLTAAEGIKAEIKLVIE
jgi:hypothetical protein